MVNYTVYYCLYIVIEPEEVDGSIKSDDLKPSTIDDTTKLGSSQEYDDDFLDMYLNEITNTNDKASSFYNLRGLESLDCVMIDLFIGDFIAYYIYSL